MIPLNIRIANFLDSVSFVADKNAQYSMWGGGDRSISSVISLGELYAQFFDDNNIDDFIEKDLFSSLLDEKEKEAIVFFRDKLRDFSKAPGKNEINDAEIIEDSEWNDLIDIAKSTLKIFGINKNHV